MLAGRYCSKCGQENLAPQQSAGHLIAHFFNDITHFDGKFFNTLKYLITQPGFLSSEYRRGRRAAYFDPVRMYIFTSAVFFLIYFSFFSKTELVQFDNNRTQQNVAAGTIRSTSDSAADNQEYTTGNSIREATSILGNNKYRDRKEFDSLRKAGMAHEGIFRRMILNKNFLLLEKYGDDQNKFIENLKDTYKRSLPQVFFLSLPLFALFLKLLYRKRKDLFYISHVIFTIHLYVFVYITLLIKESFRLAGNTDYLAWLSYIQVFFVFIILYHGYKALKNFYGESTGKTVLKYSFLLLWFVLMIMILFLVMYVFTLFKM